MRKTVMIFGVSSFLGSNLLEAFQHDYRIVGTFFETPIIVPGITTIKCDVLKKDSVQRLISMFRPDVTIYTAGLSSLSACHATPKRADALNSAGLINVCSLAERYGSKFIFISSSFVLSGEDMTYHESDTPFPATVYGSTLSSSEFYVQKSCLNYIIFRSCPLYGRAFHPTRRNWFETIEAAMILNQQINMDDQVQHGHLDVFILAKMIKLGIEKNVTNRLFQITTSDLMTRYDFAKLYCQVFGQDENLVMRGQWNFPVDDSHLRNKNIEKPIFRMDTKNVEDFFGLRMPTIEESLKATKKRLAS